MVEVFLPKVSIVIPVYNGAKYLQEAIDSALAQTYQNIEVLVINDGSNDAGATEQIALSYGDKIRYFSKTNGGVATALNLALMKMTGEYFSWLSHDDVYETNKIEIQIAFLSKIENPEHVILYSNYKFIDADSNTMGDHIMNHEWLLKKPWYSLFRSAINGCTLLIHKSVFKAVGNFDESLMTTQDYDLWFRMQKAWYSFIHIEDMLIRSRLHSEQSTQKNPLFKTEGDDLWINMIENLSDDDILKTEESHLEFYFYLAKFLKESTPYDEACLFCLDKLWHEYQICKSKISTYKYVLLKDADELLTNTQTNSKNYLKVFKERGGELFINTVFSGGAYTFLLNKSVKQAVIIIDVRDFFSLKASIYYDNEKKCDFAISDLKSFIIEQKINIININHLIWAKDLASIITNITSIVREFALELNIFVHDFYSVCPTINLLNYKTEYCGVPDNDTCNKCLRRYKVSTRASDATSQEVEYVAKIHNCEIDTWRSHWRRLFAVVTAIIHPSRFAADLWLKVYQEFALKVSVRPHNLDYLSDIKKHKTSIKFDHFFQIYVLGHIGEHKGKHIIKELLHKIKKASLNIKLNVLGIYEDKDFIDTPYLEVSGNFLRENLPILLNEKEIDCFLVPSICPETFSYVVQEAMATRLPIISFDLGAQAEFIAQYANGIIINKVSVDALFDKIHSLYQNYLKRIYPVIGKGVHYMGEKFDHLVTENTELQFEIKEYQIYSDKLKAKLETLEKNIEDEKKRKEQGNYFTEVYYDTGNGFLATQLVRSQVNFENSLYEFDLEFVSGIKKIRLDPLDQPCKVKLNYVKIILDNGEEQNLEIEYSNTNEFNKEEFIFYHDDPIFTFKSIETIENKIKKVIASYNVALIPIGDMFAFVRSSIEILKLKEEKEFQLKQSIQQNEVVLQSRQARVDNLNQDLADKQACVDNLNQSLTGQLEVIESIVKSRWWKLGQFFKFEGKSRILLDNLKK